MKVGFVLSHLHVRKDLTGLLVEMARQGVSPVVFYSKESDKLLVPENIEHRRVHAQSSLKTQLILSLHDFFGKIPKSADNFTYSCLVKAKKLPCLKRYLAFIRLWIRRHILGLVPAEVFLEALAKNCSADSSDLSCFFLSTPCLDPLTWAFAHSSGLPCHYYVYSWDHPGKADLLPADGASYMTWAPSFSRDLVELCGIDTGKVFAVGSTQLTYVHRYLHSQGSSSSSGVYLYYGCAWGFDVQAMEELRGIERLSLLLSKYFPEIKLLVRPYVMRTKNAALLKLSSTANVMFDSWFNSELGAVELDDAAVFHRLSLQDHAALFIHCGTTMGLEGAHLSSPIVLLGPEWFGRNNEISRGQLVQQHFSRHLFSNQSLNHIKSDEDLVRAIRLALEKRPEIFTYNQALRAKAPLLSMSDVVENMRRVMSSN